METDETLILIGFLIVILVIAGKIALDSTPINSLTTMLSSASPLGGVPWGFVGVLAVILGAFYVHSRK